MKNILVTLAILTCASVSFGVDMGSLDEIAQAIHKSSAGKLVTITMDETGAHVVDADSAHGYSVKKVWIGIESASNALCDLSKLWTHNNSGQYASEAIACIAK